MTSPKKVIDSSKLASIPDHVVNGLHDAITRSGFTSQNLLRIFGKEVTRHINISIREEDFLRRQVLHGLPELQALVDLLLLNHPVSATRLVGVLGAEYIDALIDGGLLFKKNGEIGSNVYLTPIGGRHFLNDGDAFNHDPGHVIQIVLEQPYLIKSVQLAAAELLSKSSGQILDLCSGSGVIGQSIQPSDGWNVTGWDINSRALDYARFNARLNNAPDTHYVYTDVLTATVERQYELVVANPPYNAHVSPDGRASFTDITLHSGVFGWNVPAAILERADSLVAQGGLFAMCGIHLMKDGVVAHPAIQSMRETGSVVVLHKVISPAATWEAMRCQFNCSPDFQELSEGRLLDVVRSADFFNEITWAITLWKKGGTPGYTNIYNLPTDGVLISPQAIRDLALVFSN